jgi:hypothetical protein
VDLGRNLSKGVDKGRDTDVILAVYIDESEADGETLIMGTLGFDLDGVFILWLGPGVNLHGVE